MDIRTKRSDRVLDNQGGLKVHLLSDSVRAAGQFQRSALGHLDHEHWLSRVRADGQKLMDLLSQMGFEPNSALKSAQGAVHNPKATAWPFAASSQKN